MALRVLIVDDHPLFREGIKALINASSGFEVAGEAGNADQGLRAALSLRPDLAVLDVSLPDMSGIQLTRKILAKLPQVVILMLSMHSRVEVVAQAFQAGALGYLLKDSASDILPKALAVVVKGRRYLDPSIPPEKVMLHAADAGSAQGNAYEILTLREQEVFLKVVQGKTSKEIAGELFISPRTVENHRQAILRKLGLRNAAEMVRLAGEIGLI